MQTFREFEHAGWEDAGIVAGYDSHLSAVTKQAIAPLLDAAGIRKGSRVLDVATGAGYVADAAARLGADATGVDFSAVQVGMARGRYPGVRFEQADAEALPFEADTFDAVLSAFGMCHFPHPETALREAFRVLKRGGRIAFTVWDTPERAVGFGALYGAVRTHGSLDVGLPAGPNFFLFSEQDASTKALRDAGFVSAAFRQVPQTWHIADPDEIFQVLTEGTVRAAATLRAQNREATQAIKASLREEALKYRRSDGYDIPMPAVMATAVKP